MAVGILIGWLALASGATFALFGADKWLAVRNRPRIAEAALLLACFLGGWPGGLAGMLVFRHKTAKLSFTLKLAFVVPAGIAVAAAVWRVAGGP